MGEEEAGSKGEQLRSDVIQLCGEESSMNIMINFLIIRSLSWQNSSPRGNGGNPIAWSFLIRLEKHSWKRLQRESPTLGGGWARDLRGRREVPLSHFYDSLMST